ncbi:MAG: phospholipid carrier-dependent glycosyltransferase [Chloroflexi bacterium]|nr:MAG: phospholipid carrier-dependent glycosyltransferase [Chloroflexota bacterium]
MLRVSLLTMCSWMEKAAYNCSQSGDHVKPTTWLTTARNRTIIGKAMKKPSSILAGLILVAFGLRVYHLGSPPLLWDEGWSIGLSRLDPREIARITALDVHPPLYYLLLKGWLTLGPHEFMTRFLSAMAGVLTVPLAYHAGRLWRSRQVGLLAALYVAIAPPLIYYSQITRMFALCVMFLVLGTSGLLRILRPGPSRWPGYLTFVIGAAGALYSFYYAGFVLAALFAYALIAAPRRWKATLAGFGTVAAAYLPWVAYAAPAMLNRVGARTGFTFALGKAAALAVSGFYGLVFPYGVGWPAVYAVLVVVAAGLILGARHLGRWALLPALPIAATLFGAALGAQAHMFAARYTIVASPFLALALAGALGLLATDQNESREIAARQSSISRFASSRGWLFAGGVVLILATTVPTITGYVYSKSYEVFDPFDPSADWQVLHEWADANDVVFFNVLSLAGTYERYRTPDDPAWSYALRWDPVVEPLGVAKERIERLVATPDAPDRLWFVLYKGTVAANADLKAWLDQRFYPAAAPGWREDTLYLAYVDPQGPWREIPLGTHFGNIVLDSARYTPGGAGSTVVGVDLVWHAEGPIKQDAKVFVHLYDEAGHLVAQHDALPVNDTRPPTSWQSGETLVDRHGLALSEGSAGPLRLAVGLYDPATGERLLTQDGNDTVWIGNVAAGRRSDPQDLSFTGPVQQR